LTGADAVLRSPGRSSFAERSFFPAHAIAGGTPAPSEFVVHSRIQEGHRSFASRLNPTDEPPYNQLRFRFENLCVWLMSPTGCRSL
jgi:hypothetical protein